ncbi:MAG: FtsX-like permease family protein [Bacteroidota bacterium]
MLKNYFTLAIKVLARRKFFTFISLFGISFTLMILMLITAFFETELGGAKPLTQKDEMVFVDMVETFRRYQDTIPEVDSLLLDGKMTYDTVGFRYQDAGRSMSKSNGSFFFWDSYFRDVPFTTAQTFYSYGKVYDIFLNSNKLTFPSTYVDANFWKIFDFKFLAGSPFKEQQVANQEQVLVLSQKACKEYFGDASYESVIGKEVILDRKHFKVVGVVDRVNNSFTALKAATFIPYTNMDSRTLGNKERLTGPFSAVFLAESSSQIRQIKDELVKKTKLIPLPNPKQHNELEYFPATFQERYASDLIDYEKPEEGYRVAIGVIIFLLSLFFMLPTLNLINLNVSRIMERSSEIGVRKAFGADAGNILFQFVFENIILTFIGGIIGFVLALLLINTINGSDFLDGTLLSFNYRVFFYSVLICLFFGILSGVIPAYRMSRIHIVNALKNNQL